MYKVMLALHLLAAIFAIGPLVGAATTASRGLRSADASATGGAARTLTIYSYASVLVVIFGFGLMSAKAPWDKSENVAEFSDPYIWISVLLWLAAMGLVLAVVVPALKQATTAIGESKPVNTMVGRVAGAGGVVGLIFAAIIVLMVYQPGS